jgi:hypothetical protein
MARVSLTQVRLSVYPACLFLGFGGVAGCGTTGSPVLDQEDPVRHQLQAIGTAYIKASNRLKHPPANRQELLSALEPGDDPAVLLVSPNDGQEFVIVWGVELRQLKARGDAVPIIAFEKEGKDGMRYVLRGRADVVRMTPGQLKGAAFPPDYVPPL